MSVAEEKIKLTATGLNNCGVAAAAAGFFTPLVVGAEPNLTRYAWLVVGLLLQLLGRWSLNALDEIQ